MPYSVPAPTAAAAPFPSPLPIHSQGRAGHRRSFSHISPPTSGLGASGFTATTTTGAFASLGALPRRRTLSVSSYSTNAATGAGARTPTIANSPSNGNGESVGSPHKKSMFHFRQDEDEDEEDSPDDVRIGDDDDAEVLRTKLKPGVSLVGAPAPASASTRPRIRVTTTMSDTSANPSSASPIITGGAVPFPRTSPTSSPLVAKGPLPFSDDKSAKTTDTLKPKRPSVSRTASTPILLSNGKPLKSSLKSSSSSPNIPFPSQSLVPSIMFPQLHPHHPYNQHHHQQHHQYQHQRAASAPTTPQLSLPSPGSSGSPSGASTPESSHAPSPTIQKNVHFPSQEEGGLATVLLFKRSAKPASLSKVGEETETETEGEGYGSGGSGSGPIWTGGFNRAWSLGHAGKNASGHVFPRKDKEDREGGGSFEVDQANSSPVPQRGAEHAVGNLFLESLGFDSSTTKPKLTGTILARNITYQKTVAVRFTLDEWHTTHEVQARHRVSLPDLPERFRSLSSGTLLAAVAPTPTPIPTVCPPISPDSDSKPEPDLQSKPPTVPSGPTWDRFVFSVNMEDYKSTLDKRTMWLVGRYAGGDGFGGGAGEWWDNNRGANYRVGFRRFVVQEKGKEEVPVVPNGSTSTTEVQKERKGEFRRTGVVSAPPSFTPPKTTLSAPQLSSSISFPGSSYSPSQMPSLDPHQRQEQRQRQEALTQSTLARLKKLNLRNYAAPSSVPSRHPSPLHSSSSLLSGSPPNPEVADADTTSTTASTITSVDSTPLHTPTQDDEDDGPAYYRGKQGSTGGAAAGGHDVNVNVLGHPDEGEGEDEAGNCDADLASLGGLRPRWRMQVEGGHVATLFFGDSSPTPSGVVTPMPSVQPVPAQDTANPSLPISITRGGRRSPPEEMAMGVEMGTSPPFSDLAGMGLSSLAGASLGMAGANKPANTGNGNGNVYWSWGSSPSAGLGMMGSMESVGASGPIQIEEKVKPDPKPAPKEKEEEGAIDVDPRTKVMLNAIKERSTAVPFAGATGQTARRHSRGSSSSEHPAPASTYSTNGGLAHLPQRKRAGTKGVPSTTVSSNSDSGSGSGSGSPSSKKPSLLSHQRHPAQHSKRRSSSPPLPTQLSLSFVDNSSDSESDSGGGPDLDAPVAIEERAKEPVVEGRTSPSQDAEKDKLYQAFVRQWCFAQGP